jgi:ubiquitin C-terminal hydrolase
MMDLLRNGIHALPLVLAFLLRLYREAGSFRVRPIAPTTRRKKLGTHQVVVQCIRCSAALFVIYCSALHSHHYIFYNGVCKCPVDENLAMRLFRDGLPCEAQIWWYIDLVEEASRLEQYSYFPSASMRQLCRFRLKQNRLADRMSRQWMIDRCYSRSACRRMKLVVSHTVSLSDLIEFLSHEGYTKVIGGRSSTTITNFVHAGRDVAALIWIPPWATSAYRAASHIQLDCSFRATRPFAYCVPQAIIRNEAVPLGFIMTPTESCFTYTTFMEELWSLMPDVAWKPPPILSDQGPGLIAFCNLKSIMQYFCHRHLIEKFGSSSAAGMLAARVLRIQTPDEFVKLRPHFIAEAQALHGKGLMGADSMDKFIKWLQADRLDFADGIWHRVDEGIARCSNHAERFHGVVNQRIKREGVYALPRRLKILHEEIVLKAAAYTRSPHRQLTTALSNLKRTKRPQRPECHDIECENFRYMMNRRFGIDSFPCAHTVGRKVTNVPPLPPLFDREYVRIFYPFRAPICELMHPKRPVPSFATAPFRPHPYLSHRKKTEKTVIVWDDEIGPDEHVSRAVPIPHFPIVRGIITGVLYLRARAKRLPAIDKIWLSYTVLDDFQNRYSLAHKNGEIRSSEDQVQWLAEYGVPWYNWAMKNKDCPVSIHIPKPPTGAQAVEEETEDSESMWEMESTAVSDCEQEPSDLDMSGLAPTRPEAVLPEGEGSIDTPGLIEVDSREEVESSTVHAPVEQQTDEPLCRTTPAINETEWIDPHPDARSISTERQIRASIPKSCPQSRSDGIRRSPRTGTRATKQIVSPARDRTSHLSPTRARLPAPSLPGCLRNLGSTCFFNAAVQCLVHVEPLQRYFADPACEADFEAPLIDDKRHNGSASVYRQLQQAMGDSQIFSPARLASIIRNLVPNYMSEPGDHQTAEATSAADRTSREPTSAADDARTSAGDHAKRNTRKPTAGAKFEPRGGADSTELLVDLLCRLDQDLKLAAPRDITDDTLSRLIRSSSAEWATFTESNTSIITALFVVQKHWRDVCPLCSLQSSRLEVFSLLPLTLPGVSRGESTSVEECILTSLTAALPQQTCERCRGIATRYPTATFERLPPVLILHLVRFIGMAKNNARVTFEDRLDLSSCISRPGSTDSCVYNLHSIIEHQGKFGGQNNHFVSYVRIGNEWRCFNDSFVSAISDDDVHKRQAYALFYVKTLENPSGTDED